jgi:homoserine O-acetyltransferase/O-succinyltransferase
MLLNSSPEAGQKPGHASSSLQGTHEQVMVSENFALASGQTLRELRLAYITLGTLAPDGRNAILLTHGYSSSHRLSKASTAEASEGGWNLLVGPGKPIDTRRYFVISSNMLGSSYGSTGPSSIDPATGRPYGGHFPEITFGDIVLAQRLLMDHLQVRHLQAVVGASYGGFQAFQWAVDHPEMVSGVVAAMSSLWAPEDGSTEQGLVSRFARDPLWNDGDFYDHGALLETMTTLRVEMLREYGAEAGLTARGVSAADMPGELLKLAAPWARQFDPHSLIVLLRAARQLTLAEHLDRVRAKVLYLLSSTDRLFPPSLATRVMGAFEHAGVDASYRLLESARGHRASHEDAALWAPDLRRFLGSL